jgi:replicative DNA helicase
MVSGAANVATRNFKTGRFGDGELVQFYTTVANLEGIPLYLSEETDLTPQMLKADLWRLKVEHGVQVFCLDYLLLMGGYDNFDETERSAKLSSGTKRIAHSLGLAGVTVNSVTKDGMDTEVTSMKHTRGSGQVIHDADVIAELAKPKNDISKLSMVKMREGDMGLQSIELIPVKNVPVFRNVTKQGQPEMAGHWYDKD